jgi:outer membrane protein OmpA-like peptidoglycan-associated protein
MKPAFLLVLALSAAFAEAQDAETVRVTHRFDWRRTVDKTYQGLVYGYITGAWKLTPSAAGTDVEARYELAAESRRNNVLTEKALDGEKTARFTIDPHGVMTGFTGDVPYYRNFPAPLPADAGPGSVWTGSGEIAWDFLGTGKVTRIPILIEYRWVGEGDYLGTPVIQVKTQYALRYKTGLDPQGDPSLARADGTHIGVISYDKVTRRVVFIRETAQELFTSASGGTVGNDGILLTFFEGVPALGTAQVVQAFNDALGRKAAPASPSPTPAAVASGTGAGPAAASPSSTPPPAQSLLAGPGAARGPNDVPDVTIEADPRGVKLTIDNLNFVADQAVLLPGEDARLASIAKLLKTVPDRNLLVVGHTAAVGSAESQDKLSMERALAVVTKLKAQGIPATKLLYEGRGGRDPVAPNDTEVGRAKNRRVEIIILDQ